MKKILVLFTVMFVALAVTAQKNMDGLIFGYKYQGNELYYKIHGKEVSVTSEVRSASYTKILYIPSEVKHKGKTYRVTGIEKYGITGASNVQKIYIPNSISRVEQHSIKDCPNLQEVHVAKGVKTVVGDFFLDCPKLKTVYLPTTVEIPNSDWLMDRCKIKEEK